MQRIEAKIEAPNNINKSPLLGRFNSLPAAVLSNCITTCLTGNEKAQLSGVNKFFYSLAMPEVIKLYGEHKQYSRECMQLYDAKMETEKSRIELVQKLWENKWAVFLEDMTLNICDRENRMENKTPFAVFKNKKQLRKFDAKILNMVVLDQEGYWITQAENYEFCVWNKKYEFVVSHTFTPYVSNPGYPPICEMFFNGKIILAEENSIKIYFGFQQLNQIQEIKTTGVPLKTYVLEDGIAVRYTNATHRFTLDGNVSEKKECIVLQRNSSSAYKGKTDGFKSIPIDKLDENNNFRGTHVLRLPYKNFIDCYHPPRGALTITFFSWNTKKGSKDKYKATGFHDIPCSTGGLFAVRDGSLFVRKDALNGFIDFVPKKPSMLPKTLQQKR